METSKMPGMSISFIRNEYGNKFLIFKSERITHELEDKLRYGSIRMQIWLEKKVRKANGKNRVKKWVHPADKSSTAPVRFSEEEILFRQGWGVRTYSPDSGFCPSYSTTNGYVPTEWEVTIDDVKRGCIERKIPFDDIISNIITYNEALVFDESYNIIDGPFEIPSGTELSQIRLIGNRTSSKIEIRVKLVIKENNLLTSGTSLNSALVGLRKEGNLPDFDRIFDAENVMKIAAIVIK